ncbi:hypothetical protein CBR_g50916 [Chara braunii]|uniref:AAA+ ATPase domain-containing protein n=1 Tax=Chara braunii TaxID=69332 RepID=A0A388M7V9_CHABU|nr:hypothetical protein CBR_g50916 [Chara braunii]|eukprot:GBG90573.1 hypothetical protein CBR_g50916 [Chara braunii]
MVGCIQTVIISIASKNQSFAFVKIIHDLSSSELRSPDNGFSQTLKTQTEFSYALMQLECGEATNGQSVFSISGETDGLKVAEGAGKVSHRRGLRSSASVPIPFVAVGGLLFGGITPFRRWDMRKQLRPGLLAAAGGVLLHGPQASGKSQLAKAIVVELANDERYHAYSVFVKCDSLVGGQIEQLKTRMEGVFQEALEHAPSVIVFDDLDALLPNEERQDDVVGDVAEHTALSEFVGDLMDACQEGGWGARQSITFLAIAQSPSSVHHVLRVSGRLDFAVQLLAPGAVERAAIIQSCLRSKAVNFAKDVAMVEVVTHCDGYDAHDIDVLVEQAIHGYYHHHLHPTSTALLSWEETSEKTTRKEPRHPLGAGEGLSQVSDSLMQTQTQTQTHFGAMRAAGLQIVDGEVEDRCRRRSLSLSQQWRRWSFTVTEDDFAKAQRGFVPAAMRGVVAISNAGDGPSQKGWEDIGGLDDVRRTLQEIRKLPVKYGKLFLKAPLRLRPGILLCGPPNCGKTHVIGAAAAACHLRFIGVKGPELLNKYIGASEQAVRDVFAKASAAAPSILFFDEFDAIAPKRGHDNTGVTDRVVNQLLTELDGVEGLSGVFVIAATSRPDLIDAALLRPRRLDRLLLCDFPSEFERKEILNVLARQLPLAADVDLSDIAASTCS